MTAASAQRELRKYASKAKALHHQRFFKTGPGQYGAGDVFIGVTVPNIRKVAKSELGMPSSEVLLLLGSKIHEERLLGLIILVARFARSSDSAERKSIYDLYTRNLKHVNNWDLVDTSAPGIVGGYLLDRSRAQLTSWAKSRDVWRRRIAVLATYRFIKLGDFGDTLRLAQLLLHDEHDLIHKAVGWMLREIGNRDRLAEQRFLKKHYKSMPRTMLRYAIEKFPAAERKAYLAGTL